MAVEGEVQVEEKAHVRSYSAFIAMMKWGAILSLLTALIVVLLISN